MGKKNKMHKMAAALPPIEKGHKIGSGQMLGKGQMLGAGQPSTSGLPGPSGSKATNPQMDEVDEEAMVVAETYAEYWPAKLKIGKKHPDAVVETASLSSVTPNDITYNLALPEDTIESGKLSALQLESIIYASQAHEQLLPNQTRAGFLIGDGAGVGKGRTVAGVIYESFRRDRKKAIWVSVSADLVEDSKRDLRDIGAKHIAVHNLSKIKYGKIDSKANGNIREGVIFSTYVSLISKQSGDKNKTRLKQLVQWCGPNFDGCIIFDECHKAKHLVPSNGKPTQTGIAVLQLQEELPNARIVYASATGASEPRNMGYMVRLGLWGEGTQFKDFAQFLTAVEKRGVGAMEVVAMDMKLRGMYIARQLSFQGVTFEIQEVQFDNETEKVYNDSVALWVEAYHAFEEASGLAGTGNTKSMWGQFWGSHQRFFKYLCIASKVKHAVKAAQDAIADGKCVVIGLQSTGEARTLEEVDNHGSKLNDFVSTAKAVFESLVKKQFPTPDSKIMRDAKTAEKKKVAESLPSSSSLKRKRSSSSKSDPNTKKLRVEGRSIVISDSDSEDSMATDIISSSDISDFEDSTYDSDGSEQKAAKDVNNNIDPAILEKKRTDGQRALDLKHELLRKISELGKRLPTNTLDNLVDLLGGPKKVAELTGRKGRVVRTSNGARYESRGENDVALEKLNLVEKDRFMKGEKLVAIISEAASNGISLQSDRRAVNKLRRVHITLELPWSADRAIQQFGRTHRANQVSAPEYIFLISNLAGERRFAASVAKRLESLGALTHADRRATDTRDLSQFNVDNRYGRNALRSVYNSIIRRGPVIDGIPPPKDYNGDFFGDVSDAMTGVGLLETIEGMNNARRMKDKDKSDIAKFLNRILGLPVKLQNHLFNYFTDTMEAGIEDAKRAGNYDMGIMDIGNADNVKLISTMVFHRKHATGIAPIELHNVEFDRGITFEEAMGRYSHVKDETVEGFYLSDRFNHKTATLAMFKDKTTDKRRGDTQMQVYRPNVGMLSRTEKLGDIQDKNRKIKSSEAEPFWNRQYDASEKMCTHRFWWGSCKNGAECDFGLRKREYYVVAGSIFAVWQRIEHLIHSHDTISMNQKLKVVRLRSTEGRKIVGVLVPKQCVEYIIEDLESDSVKVDG